MRKLFLLFTILCATILANAQDPFTTIKAEEDTVSAPPVVRATISNDTIQLVWDFIEGTIYYTLYYNNEVLADNIIDTAYNVKIIVPANYCFTVTATNGIGESKHSDEACAEVVADPDLEIPATPVISAAVINDSAVITWDVIELATYYNVYLVKDGYSLLKATEVPEAKFAIKNPGDYCFVVRAGNLAGLSEASNEDCITYPEEPGDEPEEPGDEPEEPGEGIEENAAAFNIYPNPVSDKLYIETLTQTQILTVEIYDVYGRQQSMVNGQQSMVIDVTSLNSGIYFVKVVTSEGETVKRIIK